MRRARCVDGKAWRMRDCIEHLSIGDARVLNELRRAGVPAPDRWTSLAAVPIDPRTFIPLPAAEAVPVAGRTAVWITPERSAAVVDAALFGPLTVGDATRLQPGDRVAVGRLTPAARAVVEPRDVVRFLLKVEIIETYWHVHSRLCLEREDHSSGYEATFSGTHVYFTNRANEQRLRFVVAVREDGSIDVRGY